jgi:3-methyladenine DNA glycosylase AlkC
MPDKLKDIFFTKKFIQDLGKEIKKYYSKFDQEKFRELVFDKSWEEKELKEKMRHLSHCLSDTLPKNYPDALEILKKIAPSFKGFDAMVFPDFVECYGLEYWDFSLPALGLFTKCCSSEFAIRTFLAKDPVEGMKFMQTWANDPDPMVRRLASEGCRPRLPWAMALRVFKKDPSPIIPILEKLKNDESEDVRRSVANNLNDISKDNSNLALDICERWYGESENINRLVKHACRDLLKTGNVRAMRLFGFGDPARIKVENLKFSNQKPMIGEEINLFFELKVETDKFAKIRLEYVVYYVKSKGKVSRKVFQIRELNYDPGIYSVNKKHSFLNHSTRKHFPGDHDIAIIVNGVEKVKSSVMLREK